MSNVKLFRLVLAGPSNFRATLQTLEKLLQGRIEAGIDTSASSPRRIS
jgi:hypothetical protein